MITFSSLGNKGGLGNQLFQIASTIGLANKFGHDYFFPNWSQAHFFESQLPTSEIDTIFCLLTERKFEYCTWEIGEGNFDINGWLQTEKYFDIGATRKVFTFKNDIQQELIQSFSHLFSKKTILISVRRGDFVDHPAYLQLPYNYYFLALIKFFPNWRKINLIFISDDIPYCQFHFGHLKNSFFVDTLSPMEQLIIASHCDDFIVSNSTFSWWAAWLGEKTNSKIICPIKNFREDYQYLNDKDFYPDRWIKFDFRNAQIPLKYFRVIFRGLQLNLAIKIYTSWLHIESRVRNVLNKNGN